jgi:hypothetical protein
MIKPISLEVEVPPPGQYPATVLAIGLFERGVRIFARVTYQLDSEPPFEVPEFVSLREARNGTSTLRGRARLRELAVAAGIELQSITSTSDLQPLVGARIKATIRLQEDDGIQIPQIVSVAALRAEDGGL